MSRKRRDPLAGERRVLVVLAHPDDEAFTCAGTAALLRGRGVPVTYVCATMGQMGRNMGRPPFATRESLPVLRRRELDDALRIMGIEDLRLLGLWDKTVEFEDPETLADRIHAVLVEVEPSTLITFHPQHSGHPDHMAVGSAAIRAARRLEPGRRPRVWTPAIRSDQVKLDLPVEVVDITSVQDVKLAAFRAHRSQTSGWEERMARSKTLQRRFKRLFSEERFWVYPL